MMTLSHFFRNYSSVIPNTEFIISVSLHEPPFLLLPAMNAHSRSVFEFLCDVFDQLFG